MSHTDHFNVTIEFNSSPQRLKGITELPLIGGSRKVLISNVGMSAARIEMWLVHAEGLFRTFSMAMSQSNKQN